MVHLNALKMIGLIILLAIALALPQVLPEPASKTGAQMSATATDQFAYDKAATVIVDI